MICPLSLQIVCSFSRSHSYLLQSFVSTTVCYHLLSYHRYFSCLSYVVYCSIQSVLACQGCLMILKLRPSIFLNSDICENNSLIFPWALYLTLLPCLHQTLMHHHQPTTPINARLHQTLMRCCQLPTPRSVHLHQALTCRKNASQLMISSIVLLPLAGRRKWSKFCICGLTPITWLTQLKVERRVIGISHGQAQSGPHIESICQCVAYISLWDDAWQGRRLQFKHVSW